jgi:predicted dehydrogenase
MLIVYLRPLAIIGPAKSHPEVIIAAIAARDENKAQAYAKKHSIPVVFKSYQGQLRLLRDANQ